MTDLSGSDRPINRMTDRSVVVDVERLVAGGVGLSRRDDGRVVLVDGGLPGERLEVSVIEWRGANTVESSRSSIRRRVGLNRNART